MTKKKVFKKIDFSGTLDSRSDIDQTSSETSDSIRRTTKVEIQSTAIGGVHKFDFAPWYDQGLDLITAECQNQIDRFLNKQDTILQQTSIHKCCQSLAYFLNYLKLHRSTVDHDLETRDIDRNIMDGFLAFLTEYKIARVTQKGHYFSVKAVLKALCRRGLIKEVDSGDHATFPPNPFPGLGRPKNGYPPLTRAERESFNRAIKVAVAPLLTDNVEPTSYLLACALLIVALHTGRNTWPLLELSPECLRPHPKNDNFFLVLYKRRGHSTNKVAIRRARASEELGIESIPTIRPTVANLINRVIELSKSLRSEAPEHLRDRIWLYRMQTARKGQGSIGTVTALSDDSLETSIKKLIRLHNLVDADGKPMRINVSRLRKTFINRVYEILDNDIAATAAAAGNTLQVTAVHYLTPGEDAQKNWKFMGEALFSEALTNAIGASEKTPVGKCTDNKNGEYAPKQKSQAACMNFLNCLRCRNYVVTGDDLYRLFSFYWRILYERNRMTAKHWKRQLGHIIRLIDQDVINAGLAKGIFQKKLVDAERERARLFPHPFWQSESIIQEITSSVYE